MHHLSLSCEFRNSGKFINILFDFFQNIHSRALLQTTCMVNIFHYVDLGVRAFTTLYRMTQEEHKPCQKFYCSFEYQSNYVKTVLFHGQYLQLDSLIHPALIGYSFPWISKIFCSFPFQEPARKTAGGYMVYFGSLDSFTEAIYATAVS